MREMFDIGKSGALIRQLRLRQNMTTRQVAKRCGYSPEFIGAIEANGVLDISVLLTLLDAMDYDWEIKPRPKSINEQLVASVLNERRVKREAKKASKK